MNGDVTLSLPPSIIDVSSSFEGKRVSFDESSVTGFVEVGKKRTCGRKANKVKTGGAANPTVDAAVPAPAPLTLPVSSAASSAAMYSRVATAPPPPPVPPMARPGCQVWSRLVPSTPTAAIIPGPSRVRVLMSSPSPNALERHATMGFDAGKQTQLPVTPEAIRICINQTLSNLGKVSDKTLYIREASSKLEIGCIDLTLAEHTAAQVWDRLEGCRAALFWELGTFGLTNFVFHKDVAKVRILVSVVLLAPTGRGSLWKPEDWTGDKAFDGLWTDIEGSNPGIVNPGRHNMPRSVFAMKQACITSHGIRFTLEQNEASAKAISSGHIFLFGKSRNARFFEEH